MAGYRYLSASILLSTCLAASGIVAADQSLVVAPDLAQVSIEPRPDNRSSVRLPSIEFEFSIQANCEDNWKAGSLSLSIADTSRNFTESQLASDSLDSFTIEVPEQQIAPLPLHDFCIASDDPRRPTRRRQDELVVQHVLSAHASLMCSSETAQKMTYVSSPLDILLTCRIDAEETPPGTANEL